jgi:hypothetical protein
MICLIFGITLIFNLNHSNPKNHSLGIVENKVYNFNLQLIGFQSFANF